MRSTVALPVSIKTRIIQAYPDHPPAIILRGKSRSGAKRLDG
jgi:hypothetical protein